MLAIVFSISALFAAFTVKNTTDGIKAVKVLLLFNALIEGMRWNTGVDWQTYLLHYQKYSMGLLPDTFAYFEPSYNFLVSSFNYFNAPYNLFLIFIAFFIAYTFHFSLYKFNNKVILSVLISLSTLHLFLGSNRQIIALGLSTLALINIYKSNKIRGTLLILFASTFHMPALINLVFIPEWKLKKFFWFLLLLVCMGLLIFSDMLMQIIDNTHYYYTYIEEVDLYSERRNIILGSMRIFLIYIFIFIINRPYKNLENRTIFGLSLIYIFYIIGSFYVKTLDSRGMLYIAPFFLSYAICKNYLKFSIFKKFIVNIFVIAYFSIYYIINPYHESFYPLYFFYEKNIIGNDARWGEVDFYPDLE